MHNVPHTKVYEYIIFIVCILMFLLFLAINIVNDYNKNRMVRLVLFLGWVLFIYLQKAGIYFQGNKITILRGVPYVSKFVLIKLISHIYLYKSIYLLHKYKYISY